MFRPQPALEPQIADLPFLEEEQRDVAGLCIRGKRFLAGYFGIEPGQLKAKSARRRLSSKVRCNQASLYGFAVEVGPDFITFKFLVVVADETNPSLD